MTPPSTGIPVTTAITTPARAGRFLAPEEEDEDLNEKEDSQDNKQSRLIELLKE